MTHPPTDGDAEPTAGCRTFAVPTLNDRWGKHREVIWQKTGPLVPWQVNGAADLLVPIDGTEKQFERFHRSGPDPHKITSTQYKHGNLVIVSGQPKVGKTTFLHRIIDDLAQRLNELIGDGAVTAGGAEPPWTVRENPSTRVRIVTIGGSANHDTGLARDGGVFVEPMRKVNQRILQEIIDKLGPEIRKAAPGDLDSDDPYRAYRALSKALASVGRALLVLLPDFRWKDEDLAKLFYRSCSDNAMTGIVFFVEAPVSQSQSDLAAELDDVNGYSILHLPLGSLAEGDWIRFIEKRHEASHIPGSHVRLAPDVLRGAPERWMLGSIGALQQMLYDVTQQAHENKKAVIDAASLRQYYERSKLRADVNQFRHQR